MCLFSPLVTSCCMHYPTCCWREDMQYNPRHNMHLTLALTSISISQLHFHNYFHMVLVHLGVNKKDGYHSFSTFVGVFSTTIGNFTLITLFLLLPLAFIKSNSSIISTSSYEQKRLQC